MEPYALVVGESLVDIVRAADGTTTERPGGSAANVAVALSRLGRPVRLATSFADDAHGAILARHLAEAGVELAAATGGIARTSTAVATIGEDGSASYEFDLDWRLSTIGDEQPVAVHACSLGAVLDPGADDVRALLERQRGSATITYDVNARPEITGTGREVIARVEGLVALADLVKASDEDLAAYWPDLPTDAAADRLLALGPSAVVVTRGTGGANFWARGGAGVAPAVPVAVADTIGAGDTFGAALLDGLWERGLLGGDRRPALAALDEESWRGVLTHAARAAAVTVSRPGADPPYRHEL